METPQIIPHVVTVLLKTNAGKMRSTDEAPPTMKKGDASATLTLDYAVAKRRYLGHPLSVGSWKIFHNSCPACCIESFIENDTVFTRSASPSNNSTISSSDICTRDDSKEGEEVPMNE